MRTVFITAMIAGVVCIGIMSARAAPQSIPGMTATKTQAEPVRRMLATGDAITGTMAIRCPMPTTLPRMATMCPHPRTSTLPPIAMMHLRPRMAAIHPRMTTATIRPQMAITATIRPRTVTKPAAPGRSAGLSSFLAAEQVKFEALVANMTET